MRLYSWLSLLSQILIVVTGGAVRLTGSGLGCPTWPKCTDESLVTVPEQGIHGVIEFANRLLTFALVIIAVLTFVTIWNLGKEKRAGLVWPSLGAGFGIFAQAIVGGISVLVKLNPWVVGLHFVVSAILIAIASLLVWRVYAPVVEAIPYKAYLLTPWLSGLGAISVLLGVVVTGAGPHAGDVKTPRNGLDLESLQHFHSYPAYALLIGSTIMLILVLRAGSKLLVNLSAGLVATLLTQAFVGVVQSRLGVPPLLVGFHMLLASILISILTFQFLALRAK